MNVVLNDINLQMTIVEYKDGCQLSYGKGNKIMTKEKRERYYNNLYDTEAASKQLLELFEEFSEGRNGASLVSEEGLQNMSTYFGTVPEEERGYVFLSFLADLYEEGYKYDAQQFLNMEEANDG